MVLTGYILFDKMSLLTRYLSLHTIRAFAKHPWISSDSSPKIRLSPSCHRSSAPRSLSTPCPFGGVCIIAS